MKWLRQLKSFIMKDQDMFVLPRQYSYIMAANNLDNLRSKGISIRRKLDQNPLVKWTILLSPGHEAIGYCQVLIGGYYLFISVGDVDVWLHDGDRHGRDENNRDNRG